MNISNLSPLLGSYNTGTTSSNSKVSIDSKTPAATSMFGGCVDSGHPEHQPGLAACDGVNKYPGITSSPRKLVRTDSTYEDDSFDESIRDMSHLNQRHNVLRQQWFRKNNLVSRLRRSTSTASNSSSSSSGISSNFYSSSNANNTSSFASSFSSSFSATLSSLSESCDNDTNAPYMAQSNENDYPKILRKSSFKNKLNHLYKPYSKPRRLSLQVLKNNLEFPENIRFYPARTRSLVKCSTSCYSFGNKDKRCVFGTTSIKSNPPSPNKNPGNFLGSNVGGDLSSSITATQVVIDATGSTNATESSQSGNNTVVVTLVRSKSLDDLNTLFFCPNLCSSHCETGSEDNGAVVNSHNNLCQTLQQQQQQQQTAATMSHYSSFNRICDHKGAGGAAGSVVTVGQLVSNQPPPNTNHQQLGNFFTGTNNNNQLAPLQQPNCLGMRGISSISSNHHHHQHTSPTNHPTTANLATPTANTNNNNNEDDDDNSLCDIDHVMKKISSLRV